MKKDQPETESKWRIRIYRFKDPVSFRYPIEQLIGHDKLKVFLDASSLEVEEYEKTRFLKIDDSLTIEGKEYIVRNIRLKFYDHSLHGSSDTPLTGSEVHILIEVEEI